MSNERDGEENRAWHWAAVRDVVCVQVLAQIPYSDTTPHLICITSQVGGLGCTCLVCVFCHLDEEETRARAVVFARIENMLAKITNP